MIVGLDMEKSIVNMKIVPVLATSKHYLLEKNNNTFMEKLSNAEVEFNKSVAYNKSV